MVCLFRFVVVCLCAFVWCLMLVDSVIVAVG